MMSQLKSHRKQTSGSAYLAAFYLQGSPISRDGMHIIYCVKYGRTVSINTDEDRNYNDSSVQHL